ncbi:MAG: leucyl aminopeptidase [Nitrososphaerales archaeon]
MLIKAKVVEPWQEETDMLAVGVFEEQNLDEFDDFLKSKIRDLKELGDFKGRKKEVSLIYPSNYKAKRIFLLGLGKREELELEDIREASGKIALKARELKLKVYSSLVIGRAKFSLEESIFSMAEASNLALYSFNQYKKKEKEEEFKPEEFRIIVKAEELDLANEAIKRGNIVAEATNLARDIANAPPHDMPPRRLAEIAKEICEKNNMNITIWDKKQILEKGMGGLVAVSKGSEEEPRFIVMEYKGSEDKPLIIVGKAVTFDSGGISIKPSEKMEEMKYDKAGGASVIGIMKAISELKLKAHVIGIIPAVENLPSGSAYKPGDIITFYNRKSSEVISTDAEGRMILADALSYACTLNPKAIIDLATLTGACVIALGNHASGLISNNDDLANRLYNSGMRSCEKVWRLPLWSEYFEQIKSDVADIKNSGGKGGGAITAAAFLKHFVDDNTPWAHLDIAGTAWTQENTISKSYQPKGATGIGVRLILDMIINWK